jgi:predicted PurR-regulated permease PerM
MNRKEKELETLLSINIVLILLFFFFAKKYLLLADLVVIVSCLLWPLLLKSIHKVWSAFFSFIGRISSTILLFLVFFLFLTPIALLKKIFTKKPSSDTENNYVKRDHIFTPENLSRMG